jgi:hypothetical protein
LSRTSFPRKDLFSDFGALKAALSKVLAEIGGYGAGLSGRKIETARSSYLFYSRSL